MRIVANSQWFLDPEAWEFLANDLLPSLTRDRPRLSAWSAGCFTGKEPFSLAILLAEAQPDLQWSILATDKSASALDAARRRGPFGARDIENVPDEWRRRHLELGAEVYARTHLLDRMDIVEHDLLHDPFPSNIDLVLFRNLETCFAPEEYLTVWRDFAATVRSGGIVFVGALDRAPPQAEQDFERLRTCFYRRVN